MNRLVVRLRHNPVIVLPPRTEKKRFAWLTPALVISVVALCISGTQAYLQNRDNHNLTVFVTDPTDGSLSLVFINNGNRNEFVISARLLYSSEESLASCAEGEIPNDNLLVKAGDRQLIRRKIAAKLAPKGESYWLGVRLIAINSDAEWVQREVPVARFVWHAEGGRSVVPIAKEKRTIRLITNKRPERPEFIVVPVEDLP